MTIAPATHVFMYHTQVAKIIFGEILDFTGLPLLPLLLFFKVYKYTGMLLLHICCCTWHVHMRTTGGPIPIP